jgi:hypothetical protein
MSDNSQLITSLKNPFFKRTSPQIEYWNNGEIPLFYKAKLRKNFPSIYLDKNNPITYIYNDMGYRSTTSTPPENKDYLVAFGCSLTWGSSLHQEHRYSDRIEEHLKIPVINLALPGGSANFILEQVSLMILNLEKFPKYAFIQWPTYNRFTLLGIDNEYIINAHSSETHNKNIYNNIIKMNQNIFLSKYMQSYLLVNKLLSERNTKCINFSFDTSDSNILNCKFIQIVDTARDGIHAGINTHMNVTEFILSEIQNDNG